MNSLQRFKAALNFQPVDRLPVIEWAPWWDKTIERWRTEGLPVLESYEEYFGLDPLYWCRFSEKKPGIPTPAYHGAALVRNEADYDKLRRDFLYTEPADQENLATLKKLKGRTAKGEVLISVAVAGFFYWPRALFGIEPHFFAFYDHAPLMHRMNADQMRYIEKTLDYVLGMTDVAMIVLNEDLSYNHGPMISKDLFDEFMAPYYREFTAMFRKRGLPLIVDTDGLMEEMIPWFTEVGMDGCLPIERQAANDIPRMRRNHPAWRMVGGFDKMVMHKGEAAMRREFERLLPVMKGGGYVLGVDHQTPPEVSLNDYRLYLKLFNEYARRAATR